jgi:phage tail-like protein
MPPSRDAFAVFTYLISVGGTLVGGFSEVSGLGRGLTITLKRGVSGPLLTGWLKAARDGGGDRRRVTITQVDAARRPARTWELRGALPKKYVAATLNAAGNEVAMEEIQLTCEGIEPASSD